MNSYFNFFQINKLNTYLHDVNFLTQVNSYILGWMFSCGNNNVGDKIFNENLNIIFSVVV